MSALKVVHPLKVIRDAGYAQRLTLACDRSDHCPPLHQGRLVWIMNELGKQFDVDVTTETVRKWLHGEAKPRLDKNNKLAELLRVDPVWLYQGIDPALSPREKKARNAMADGAVNLIAGFIQMDGGSPAFPDEGDKRAARDNVDLYAIIKGGSYAIHVCLGAEVDGAYHFPVPLNHEHVVVLGVIRDGFSVMVTELTAEIIAEHGGRRGGAIDVVLPEIELIESFSRRL